jgi:thiol-disulfide isomerase/thioredoxin
MGIARQRCLATALLIFLILVPTVVPEIYEEDPDLPYLYDENAGVVIEYMPSANVKDPVRPDFLYSTDNGPRLVEFYAPWCPHVRRIELQAESRHREEDLVPNCTKLD